MNRAILAIIALLLIALGAWYLLCAQLAVAPAPLAPTLSQDVYPLYAGASWGTPVNESFLIGTTTYSGASIASALIDAEIDPGGIFTPFESYYDTKLKALGYQVANELAAGGHVGGQTGYRKGSSIILTRFHINYKNVTADAPSECPCDVTLSLFSQ